MSKSFIEPAKAGFRIAIIGGGPAALYLYQALISIETVSSIDIFEKSSRLGQGMPYGSCGANPEHVTNVSDNEIPQLPQSIEEWISTADPKLLKPYDISPANFNEYKVLPRLLFGEYLAAQFQRLIETGTRNGIATRLHMQTTVRDLRDHPESESMLVIGDHGLTEADQVIICTGHSWPARNEGKIPGYFDSPYPPAKLNFKINDSVAIRGASLTAIDAIRTLARANGSYERKEGKLAYSTGSPNFSITMHSLHGLLPAVRFHLNDTQLHHPSVLSESEIAAHIRDNDGFLSLDFIFEKNFRNLLKESDPELGSRISGMNMESFVGLIMNEREQQDAFELLKKEYLEAEKSIKRRKSIYWKELLATLSFTMNYPAKYFSAEDMQRLKKTLHPLISIVIAFVPQSSCEEMLALHEAGVLTLRTVDDYSRIEALAAGGINYHYGEGRGERQKEYFPVFIDCVGQAAIPFEEFPFPTLIKQKVVNQATLRYRDTPVTSDQQTIVEGDGNTYYLKVSGVAVNDYFQAMDENGAAGRRLFIMAVPLISGYNPDYSGLDFCEEAAKRIAEKLKLIHHSAGQSAKLAEEVDPIGNSPSFSDLS